MPARQEEESRAGRAGESPEPRQIPPQPGSYGSPEQDARGTLRRRRCKEDDAITQLKLISRSPSPRLSSRPSAPVGVGTSMAVRSSTPAPTPFSIQAILNKKEERGARSFLQGRLQPAGGAVAGPDVAPACCWRLFGDEAAVLAAALQQENHHHQFPLAPTASRAPAGHALWDSDSALSEEQEGDKEEEEDDDEEEEDEGTVGATAVGPREGPPYSASTRSPSGSSGKDRPVQEQPQDEPLATLSDSELSARVSGTQSSRGRAWVD